MIDDGVARAALDDIVTPTLVGRPVRDAAGDVVALSIVYANAAAQRWGPAVGHRWTHLDDATVRDVFHQCLTVIRTGLRVDEPSVRVAGPSGEVRTIELTVTRLGDDLLITWRDVTAQRAAEAELARRATYDPLTGLANRSLLLERIGHAVAELERGGGVLAVLFLDLDRFKAINDVLGHAAGDAVLTTVGHRLASAVRAPDTAARLAGDEFVVVCRVGADLDAVRLAERLHDLVREPIPIPDGHPIVVRPSIGVTTTASPAARAPTLLREADMAMYQAKHRSQAPWALYDEDLNRLALERLATEDMLRAALADDGLELVYQPIVEIATGRVTSAEALLRVRGPDGGLLTPDRFIDVAEDSDLILPIGGWVLREACRQLKTWRDLVPDLTVAVNVSARQVARLVLHDQVVEARTAAGTDPRGLVVEITERVLLDAEGPAVAELLCVTDDGSGLAIDDFGTGYSSMAHLKRLPVDVLKVDGSFVGGLGAASDDTAIVEAIVGLGRTLGLVTVAEGVETVDQLALLREMGCECAQGWLFGRPMAPEHLTAILRHQVAPTP